MSKTDKNIQKSIEHKIYLPLGNEEDDAKFQAWCKTPSAIESLNAYDDAPEPMKKAFFAFTSYMLDQYQCNEVKDREGEIFRLNEEFRKTALDLIEKLANDIPSAKQAGYEAAIEKNKKYSGQLNQKLEPIYSSILGSIGQKSPVYMPEDIQKRNKQIDIKMRLLADHFGIKKDKMMWGNLAYTLAAAHVPGLQVSNPDVNVGVKKKWTDDRLAVLLICMKTEMTTKNCTATHAAKNLANKAPWKTLVTGKNAPEALRKQYEASKSNANIKEYASWYGRQDVMYRSITSNEDYEKELARIVKRGELEGVWK